MRSLVFSLVAIIPAFATPEVDPAIHIAPYTIIEEVAPVEVDEAALKCLADNIYHEARGEDKDGWISVASITLNRVESKRYPNDVCGVVWQKNCNVKYPAYNGCTAQFTWTWDGKDDSINEKDVYAEIKDVAEQILTGETDTVFPGATLYHTHQVSPSWSKSPKTTHVGDIGGHKFYTES